MVRVEPTLDELIRRHAFERGVSKDAFCRDILHLVVEAITDPEDELFNPARFGLQPLAPIPTRYAGYRESLGFISGTPEDPASHMSPLPRAPADMALLTVIPENEI